MEELLHCDSFVFISDPNSKHFGNAIGLKNKIKDKKIILDDYEFHLNGNGFNNSFTLFEVTKENLKLFNKMFPLIEFEQLPDIEYVQNFLKSYLEQECSISFGGLANDLDRFYSFLHFRIDDSRNAYVKIKCSEIEVSVISYDENNEVCFDLKDEAYFEKIKNFINQYSNSLGFINQRLNVKNIFNGSNYRLVDDTKLPDFVTYVVRRGDKAIGEIQIRPYEIKFFDAKAAYCSTSLNSFKDFFEDYFNDPFKEIQLDLPDNIKVDTFPYQLRIFDNQGVQIGYILRDVRTKKFHIKIKDHKTYYYEDLSGYSELKRYIMNEIDISNKKIHELVDSYVATLKLLYPHNLRDFSYGESQEMDWYCKFWIHNYLSLKASLFIYKNKGTSIFKVDDFETNNFTKLLNHLKSIIR